jgi:hypothetical protein
MNLLDYFTDDGFRTQFATVDDNPNRIAPPDYYESAGGPAFGELPIGEQLEIAEGVCRREPYASALLEALPESEKYRSFLSLALERSVSDADLGKLARGMILDYLQAVAVVNGDDLAEMGR